VIGNTSGKLEQILAIASRTVNCSSVKPEVSIKRCILDTEKLRWLETSTLEVHTTGRVVDGRWIRKERSWEGNLLDMVYRICARKMLLVRDYEVLP